MTLIKKNILEDLKEYVGSKGKYTPLVKMTTLYINDERIKDYIIVDTPGTNDPIISRGQKTKEFLGKCDYIIFLSYSSQFLDNNDRIISVKNYLEIQKKLLIELYMLEIRNPDYKDVLEYIEEKLEDERNFINYIMELDFMEFLFGGREKNKKIREFYGIDRKKNIEVDVLQEMKGNIEKIKYSINPASLNKILLQYRLNNEKIPEYYLDGSGEKIYENFKILKAFLKIKSGRKNDLEREIELTVKNLSRELEV